jgi:hypothetical protein
MDPREILPTDQAHVLSRDVLVTELKLTFRLSTRRQKDRRHNPSKPGCR